jgi:hypothetical protein
VTYRYELRFSRRGILRRVALVRTDVLRLLVTANAVPSSSILFTLMMEALGSSETSVLRRIKLRQIPDDGILHTHGRENLKIT